MDDKGIQVAIGLKRRLTSTGSQITPEIRKEEHATQCEMWLTGSYGHNQVVVSPLLVFVIARMQDKEC